MSVSVSGFCQDGIFRITQPFVTDLGKGMHNHELECHAKKIIADIQSHGHKEGSYMCATPENEKKKCSCVVNLPSLKEIQI